MRRAELDGAHLLEGKRFLDERGCFANIALRNELRALREDLEIHQISLSRSRFGVLRGLHYQFPTPQGKLIAVLRGEIFDVFVDLRAGSETFACWSSIELSGTSRHMLFLEPGFAHGFLVLAEPCEVLYVLTESYLPEENRSLLWNDPELAIDWPMQPLVISERDSAAPTLAQARALRLL